MLRNIGLALIILFAMLFDPSGVAHGLSIEIFGISITDCEKAPCPADSLDTDSQKNVIGFDPLISSSGDLVVDSGLVTLEVTPTADGANTASASLSLSGGFGGPLVVTYLKKTGNRASVDITVDSSFGKNALAQGFSDIKPTWTLSGTASGLVFSAKPMTFFYDVLGRKGLFTAVSPFATADTASGFSLDTTPIKEEQHPINNIQEEIMFAFDPNAQAAFDQVELAISCGPTPTVVDGACSPGVSSLGVFNAVAATIVPSPSSLLLLVVGLPIIAAWFRMFLVDGSECM